MHVTSNYVYCMYPRLHAWQSYKIGMMNAHTPTQRESRVQ